LADLPFAVPTSIDVSLMQTTNHDRTNERSSASDEELHRSRSVTESIKLFNGGKDSSKRPTASPDRRRSYASDTPILTKTINLNAYREPTVNVPQPEKTSRKAPTLKTPAFASPSIEVYTPTPKNPTTTSIRKPPLAPRPVMRTGSPTPRTTPPPPPPPRPQNTPTSIDHIDTNPIPPLSPGKPSYPPRPTTPTIGKSTGIVSSPSFKPQHTLPSKANFEARAPTPRSNSDPKSPTLKSSSNEKSAWSPPSMSSVSNVAATTTSVLKGTFDKLVNGVNDLLVTAQGTSTGANSTSSSSAPHKNLISSPYNMTHVTHVGFNHQTGEFTGLPKEWQVLLNQSGITRREQEANPQAVLDAISFFKETREDPDDEVWQKFEMAQSQHPPRLPNPSLISNTENPPPGVIPSRPPPLPKRQSRPRIVVVNSNHLSSSMTPNVDKQTSGSKPPPIPVRPNLTGKTNESEKVR
jgi:P21-Rho-binding domain